MGTKNYSSYSDLITFSRASTGTYLDSDGLLKSAAINTPRVEYDYQGNRLGLLVEEARTNYVPDSENFTSYTSDNITQTSATSQLGLALTKITPTVTNDIHRLVKARSVSSGTTYTFSIYAKTDGYHLQMVTENAQFPDGGYANFDLTNGTVSASAVIDNATIENVGGGLYRCSVTATADVSGSHGFNVWIIEDPSDARVSSFSGDGTSGVIIGGAQEEIGAFPTSYIPTSGATATRSADVASIGVGAFGYNKGAGTTVVSAVSFASTNFRYFYSFHDNSGGYNNSSLLFLHTTSALPTYQRLSAGAYQVNTTQSIAYTPGQVTKFAVAEAVDDMSFVQDAGDPKVDTAGVFPIGVETMNVGSNPVNGQTLNGHISSIAYYPRRLTDAQIKALTSPPETPTLSLTFDDSTTSYLETSIHG